MAPDRHRLPATASPSHYQLLLEPDVEQGTFSGTVAIALTVSTTSDELVCNALDIAIDEAWVDTGGQRADATATLDVETERVHFALASKLEPGEHTLHVRFRGELNDK